MALYIGSSKKQKLIFCGNTWRLNLALLADVEKTKIMSADGFVLLDLDQVHLMARNQDKLPNNPTATIREPSPI